jgi:hypothetical protein
MLQIDLDYLIKIQYCLLSKFLLVKIWLSELIYFLMDGSMKWFFSVAFVFFFACSSMNKTSDLASLDDALARNASTQTESDLAQNLYQDGAIRTISIDMKESDWETLRNQQPSLPCTIDPLFSYSKFSGTLTIDGFEVGNVKLRKKSFCGSLSSIKPSIKIEKDKADGKKTLFSTKSSGAEAFKTLVLNNSIQDGSYMRQCFGFKLMRDFGYPAPRCNFARLLVNKALIGLYINVEPLDENFAIHNFGKDAADGLMVEGDWTGNMTGRKAEFYKENPASVFDVKFPNLAAVEQNFSSAPYQSFINVLEKDPLSLNSEDVTALGNFLDLEQFRRFYLLENLLAHWDGATGNRNNYYLYYNPNSRLWQFIPSGMDQILLWIPGKAYTDMKLAQVYVKSPVLSLGLAEDYATLTAKISEPERKSSVYALAEKIRPFLKADELALFDKQLEKMTWTFWRMLKINPKTFFPAP